MGDAAPGARPAVMAGGASQVILCQDCATADGEDALAPPPPCHGFLDVKLGTVELHRRQKLPIRELRQSLRLTADADEALNIAVPRRDVRVTDRPVDAHALFC